MFQRVCAICMVMSVLLLMNTNAAAQRIGGMSSSGFGSSGFGSSGFGSSRMGGAGFSGSRFGSSAFNSGFGGGGFGSSGFGGGFGSAFGGGGFGSSGFGGGGFGNSGFGMGNYSGGQAFIGRDSGDMASAFSQMSRAGTQYFNQMNRSARRSQRNQRSTPAVETVPQPMLVKIEVAFDSPQPTPAMVATSLRTRLGKILAEHNIVQPLVTMEGDTAVLRGVAETENQRLVMEKLVALEPGVGDVRNEMTVIPPATSQGLLPTDN